MVLLLLDATRGVTDQDAHIADILESSRAMKFIAVNKWDAGWTTMAANPSNAP